MFADTSDIYAFGVALGRHADDLAAVASGLTAAQVSADAFGPVGAGFLAALNDALTQEAHRVTQLAERLAAATSTAGAAATAYGTSELVVGRAISTLGG
jgi:hypothetical protein